MTKHSPGSQTTCVFTVYDSSSYISTQTSFFDFGARYVSIWYFCTQSKPLPWCARHKASEMPGKRGKTRGDLGSGLILQPDPGPANWKANTSPFKEAYRGQAAVNARLPTVPPLKLYLYAGFMNGCNTSQTSVSAASDSVKKSRLYACIGFVVHM